MTNTMQVSQGKTVEENVLSLLRAFPEARYDDMVLCAQYYNNFCPLPAGEMALIDLATDYKLMGLPCFETIRRARQRVQSCFPELSRHPKQQKPKMHIFVQLM